MVDYKELKGYVDSKSRELIRQVYLACSKRTNELQVTEPVHYIPFAERKEACENKKWSPAVEHNRKVQEGIGILAESSVDKVNALADNCLVGLIDDPVIAFRDLERELLEQIGRHEVEVI